MGRTIAAIAWVLCIATSAYGQDATKDRAADDATKILIEELRLLRQKIESLEAKIDGLEKEVRALREGTAAEAKKQPKARAPKTDKEKFLKDFGKLLPKELRDKIESGEIDPPGGFGSFDDHERRGPDRAALAEIELPEDPSEQDVKAYINVILDASIGQNTVGSDDPQIGMLAAVGHKHFHLLLAALLKEGKFSGFAKTHYLRHAIGRLATDEDKPEIIDALERHRELVEIVLAKGWCEDAKDVLIRGLAHQGGVSGLGYYVPTEWIEAVAELRDPKTYPDLERYLARGSNPAMTYDAIRDLPGIELADAVGKAWKRTRGPMSFGRDRLAPIALGYGHFEALESTIGQLEDAERWEIAKLRTALQRHTEARGSNDAIRKWFDKSRELLRWDAKTRRWRVGA